MPVSVLLPAISRQFYRVDNNLIGVSGQVIAPGVLVFTDIFDG